MKSLRQGYGGKTPIVLCREAKKQSGSEALPDVGIPQSCKDLQNVVFSPFPARPAAQLPPGGFLRRCRAMLQNPNIPSTMWQ